MNQSLSRRARMLSAHTIPQTVQGPVMYWMSRDQRIDHNWALVYAAELAEQSGTHLDIVFALAPTFLGATMRHYDFMLKGLEEVEKRAQELGINFILLQGNPPECIADTLAQSKYGALVTDFSPLKISRQWKKQVVDFLHTRESTRNVPCIEVDAHNIVPTWLASPKQEFAARTFRPKLAEHMKEFFVPFPKVSDVYSNKSKGKHLAGHNKHSIHSPIDWDKVRSSCTVSTEVGPVDWIIPGAQAAHKVLQNFVEQGFKKYADVRNEPSVQGQSNLSPYLHFGQISAQYAVQCLTQKLTLKELSRGTFFDEIVVRRELSDNFCFYNPDYDSLRGAPTWAQETLRNHIKDKRDYTYTYEQLRDAGTHDELWNAAQNEMLIRGKMAGYMRMYWAKKILEWTESPEQAIEYAIKLNDTYELDGRDPNGYVGILWSIAGLHDRPWFNRKIFGLIRYMSEKGVRAKINAQAYIDAYSSKKSLF